MHFEIICLTRPFSHNVRTIVTRKSHGSLAPWLHITLKEDLMSVTPSYTLSRWQYHPSILMNINVQRTTAYIVINTSLFKKLRGTGTSPQLSSCILIRLATFKHSSKLHTVGCEPLSIVVTCYCTDKDVKWIYQPTNIDRVIRTAGFATMLSLTIQWTVSYHQCTTRAWRHSSLASPTELVSHAVVKTERTKIYLNNFLGECFVWTDRGPPCPFTYKCTVLDVRCVHNQTQHIVQTTRLFYMFSSAQPSK